MQGYAFILTHPGVPCVYWKHYFEWNRGNEIKALVKARKTGRFFGLHRRNYVSSV